ncbi:MAG: group II intron maturase-specific domain-containing protein [Prevotella sp.]
MNEFIIAHLAYRKHSHLDWKLQQVGTEIESQVRGWYNYYNKFGKTEFVKVMNHLNIIINQSSVIIYRSI